MEKLLPEGFISNEKTVVPFYNKYLPKFLRRTTKVEFYPNTSIKKSEVVLNHQGTVLRAEQFDKNGNSTYLETYNPRTRRGFVRKNEYGALTERTYIGRILVKLEKFGKFDNKNKVVYRETFNPKTKKKVVETDSQFLKTKTEYIDDKLVYNFIENNDGKICEETINPFTNQRLVINAEPENLGNGRKSRLPVINSVELQDAYGVGKTLTRGEKVWNIAFNNKLLNETCSDKEVETFIKGVKHAFRNTPCVRVNIIL